MNEPISLDKYRARGKPPPLFHDASTDLEEVEFVDAEVLDDAEVERLHAPARAVVVVRAAVTHHHTRTFVRHIAYIGIGRRVQWRHRQERKGTAFYDDAIRAQNALGDFEKAKELLAEKRQYRKDAMQRTLDWSEIILKHLVKLPWYVGGSFGLLTLLGLAVAASRKDAAEFIAPFQTVFDIANFVYTLASILWAPTALAALAWTVYGWWHAGRHHHDLPAWALPPGQRPMVDDAITPSIVVVALRELGIPALKKAINDMGDMGAAMLGTISEAGPGVEVDVLLPQGVSTVEVQTKRRKLAENLNRHEREVFITVAPKARTVTLWIADSGALDTPVDPSPLTWDNTLKADYYTGKAPWGMSLRNAAILVSLFQQHVLVTGKSNQGKTSVLRALALWLALDPTVEFKIGDLKGVGDWAMFFNLATTLIQGPTDEKVIAVTHMVEAAVEEMNRRIDALEKSGSAEGITRDMARTPGSGFHPLVIIVDEAQVAYMCGAKGEDGRPYGGQSNLSRYFTAVRQIHNQGRAVNVTLWQGTQDPNDKNLPAIARDGAHIRAALYLPTESKAKMALGEAPVEQGAAPHKLRDGLDRGTVVAHGPGIPVPVGEPAITIRTHFIDGKDAATIADRAKARRANVVTRVDAGEDAEDRDLIRDLEEVLRDQVDRIRLKAVLGLLVGAFPSYKPYEGLTVTAVTKILKSNGFPVPTPQGYESIDPPDFRAAFARLANGGVR